MINMDWGEFKIWLVPFGVTIFLLLLILIVPFALVKLPPTEVNVEYLNGLLVASSIIFGFWAVILTKKPTGPLEDFTRRSSIKPIGFCFIILLVSILLMYYAALGLTSASVGALISLMISLSSNLCFLMIYLYYESKRKNATSV